MVNFGTSKQDTNTDATTSSNSLYDPDRQYMEQLAAYEMYGPEGVTGWNYSYYNPYQTGYEAGPRWDWQRHPDGPPEGTGPTGGFGTGGGVVGIDPNDPGQAGGGPGVGEPGAGDGQFGEGGRHVRVVNRPVGPPQGGAPQNRDENRLRGEEITRRRNSGTPRTTPAPQGANYKNAPQGQSEYVGPNPLPNHDFNGVVGPYGRRGAPIGGGGIDRGGEGGPYSGPPSGTPVGTDPFTGPNGGVPGGNGGNPDGGPGVNGGGNGSSDNGGITPNSPVGPGQPVGNVGTNLNQDAKFLGGLGGTQPGAGKYAYGTSIGPQVRPAYGKNSAKYAGPFSRWGEGGASGNRSLAGGRAFAGYASMMDNPDIDAATKAYMKQDSENAINAKYAGAAGQIARNAATHGSNLGSNAALTQLAADQAGDLGQGIRDMNIKNEQERQRRYQWGTEGVQGMYGGEGAFLGNMFGQRAGLSSQPLNKTTRTTGTGNVVGGSMGLSI